MPTQVIPNPVETAVAWDRSGLTGTIAVRVIDNVANTTPYARNTAIVTEYPVGSAVYQATIPDFGVAGPYTIVWDDFVRYDTVPLTVTSVGTSRFGAASMTETLGITTSGLAINVGDFFGAASMTETLAITTTVVGESFAGEFADSTPSLIGAFAASTPSLIGAFREPFA